MTTYTIAFTPEMLIAIVPDGESITGAIKEYEADTGETFTDYVIKYGLTLTDEAPDDRDTIVFISKSGSCGFLMGTDGHAYDYAVQ